MYALRTHQIHHRAVLWKQGHRRGILTFENTLQVFSQSKARTLYFGCRIITTELGALNELLRQCLHGTQHFGGRTQSHHLQRTNALVKLLTGYSQMAGIQLSQVGTSGEIRITDKAA